MKVLSVLITKYKICTIFLVSNTINISNTDNCERATRLLGQRYDVYSKYHKVGNSFNFFKYTHKNKPIVYQKQTTALKTT